MSSKGRIFTLLWCFCLALSSFLFVHNVNAQEGKEQSKPIVVKESDFIAEKEKAEKEVQIYGNGLSVGDIIDYADRIRPRLRRAKTVDIASKFKRYFSITRKVRESYIRVLNLEGVSFSGENMSRTNFALSHLVGANFSGSNLRNTVFAYADLSGANFSGADLRGADFSRANLENADFSGAIVSNTNFYKANIESIKTALPKDLEKIKKSVNLYRVSEY